MAIASRSARAQRLPRDGQSNIHISRTISPTATLLEATEIAARTAGADFRLTQARGRPVGE
jgi:hypothetical protein